MLNLDDNSNIFFIGIGGVSMSSLAEILKNLGHNVSGSNNTVNQMTDFLKAKDIKIHIGHDKNNILEDTNLVVYTSAISNDNPELVRAKELGIPCVERATVLGEIMKMHEYPIAISGTHGKTTTSSMVSEMFLHANTNPTITVGGVIKTVGTNTVIGDDKYLIAEACEYKDAFLHFFPHTSIILNIDEDHLDYFKDINQIRDSFNRFIHLLPAGGNLIINNNIEDLSYFTSDLDCNIITYGNMNADVKAENIVYDINGCGSFDVMYKDEKFVSIKLRVPGYHNVSNALAAVSCGIAFDLNKESIIEGIEAFLGAERRLELKGEFNSVKVIDDYAHHPTEITASITSINAMPHNKSWVVFQSHTYTRTKALLDDFALSLSKADNIIITDIYAAREENTVNVYPSDLVDKISELNKNVIYIKSFNDIASHLKANTSPGDIVAIMGAGDVNKICSLLVK